MKRVLLVLTAIMLVFAVVGCNSNGAPTTVRDPGTGGDEEGGDEDNIIASKTALDYTDQPNIKGWTFNVADILEADYFAFFTDGTLPGANTDGFGGIQILFQNNGGGYGMTDEGDRLKFPDWTNYDRSGYCMFVIDKTKLPDVTANSNEYVGTGTGDVRIMLGYWSNFDDLALTGEAVLLKGPITKPAGALDITDIGFVFPLDI